MTGMDIIEGLANTIASFPPMDHFNTLIDLFFKHVLLLC